MVSARHRHARVDPSVRTLFVVMPDVLSQNLVQVTSAEYEHPVEAFCPHGPHPAFRVSIGSRRANGGVVPENPIVTQAVSSYSWMSPPSRSRR